MNTSPDYSHLERPHFCDTAISPDASSVAYNDVDTSLHQQQYSTYAQFLPGAHHEHTWDELSDSAITPLPTTAVPRHQFYQLYDHFETDQEYFMAGYTAEDARRATRTATLTANRQHDFWQGHDAPALPMEHESVQENVQLPPIPTGDMQYLHVSSPQAEVAPAYNPGYTTQSIISLATDTRQTGVISTRTAYGHRNQQLLPPTSQTPSMSSIVPSANEPESLTFKCGERTGIRLDLVLLGDMQGLSDPTYRGFFENHRFGEKAAYRIPRDLRNMKPYIMAKRCRGTRRNEPIYITRKDIVRQVAEVTRDFIQATPAFYTHPDFKDWPAGSGIENFVLVELKKISKASVQPIFRYRASAAA